MVRTQIQLSERQARAVKERARQKGISVAEYIRHAVNESLDNEERPDCDELVRRSLAAVGRFRSDVDDLSVRHDHYLAEAFGQ